MTQLMTEQGIVTDFGLTWQSRLAGGGLLVGEEVNLLLDLSAVAS
jgi:hypothetical protein